MSLAADRHWARFFAETRRKHRLHRLTLAQRDLLRRRRLGWRS